MKDLTRGFDLVAQLSEDVCEYIFRMAYWSDLPFGIPDFVSESNASDSADVVELYFSVPRLEFVSIGDLQNTVRITFAFKARVFPETVEASAVVTVAMAATLSTDGSNVIVVDFVDAPDQFKISDSFPRDDALLDSRVKPVLVKTLFLRLKGRPISPPVSATIPFFTFRTHILPLGRFLGVYVMRENNPSPAPGGMEAWVQNDVYRPTRPRSGVAIGLPRELVIPIIERSLVTQGFGSSDLLKASPTDDTITINSLSMSLEPGYIRVVGNVTKEIDVLPDPDVDFEVWIGLWIQNGVLEVHVLHVDADLPWWLSTLHFLLPFAGTVIIDVIRRAVPEAIAKAIGGVAQGSVSEVAAFGSDLPNAGGLVKVTNTGTVSIRPSGLVIPGQAETIFNPRDIKAPLYIFGNYETKEFHRPDCQYFLAMKAAKRMPFINPLHALRSGYNGCAWCFPIYNDPHPGRVVFLAKDDGQDVNFAGKIEGQRTDSLTVGGLVVEPKISMIVSFRVTAGHLRWWQIPTGQWRFIFSMEDSSWFAECLVDVPIREPSGVLYITATRGKPSCNHALGAAPPFP